LTVVSWAKTRDGMRSSKIVNRMIGNESEFLMIA